MNKLEMFLTLKGGSARKTHPKSVDSDRKRDLSNKTDDACVDPSIAKFQEERKRIIDVLFTGIHYQKLSAMGFETVDIQFGLYRGVGPSRMVTFSCRHAAVFKELSGSLLNPHDRLHAGCGRHNLIVAVLVDQTGAHDDIEIPLQQTYPAQRALSPPGKEIRALLQTIFDEEPKPSPFRIRATTPEIRERIADILNNSQRVKAQLQKHGFQRIVKSGELDLFLFR